MTSLDFDDLFNVFNQTVSRLEALPKYNVGGAEAERIEAFRNGLARPERNVRTDPWLARIALTTITAGKVWERCRVVDDPLTDYQRYQIESHKEAQACGERIVVASRSAAGTDLGPDFWLFDEGTPQARAATMHYDERGRFLGAEVTRDVTALQATLDRIRRLAIPLNLFLARGAGA